MRVAAVVVLAAVPSGCSHIASVQVWRPASMDITGVRTLAVLDFEGENDSGRIGRSAVLTQLSHNGHYTLVDSDQLKGAVGARGPIDTPTALAAARRLGVDAVLKGQVVSYHVSDDVYSNQNLHVGEDEFGFENNETVDREATVTLAIELVDAAGRVRGARSASHSFRGQMVNGEGNLPARDRILQELLHECSSDILTMVAPYQDSIPVNLASPWYGEGSAEVRRGVELAKQGSWGLAEQSWRAALNANPASHAAMFNLAVASEARFDYAAAEQYLLQALRTQPKASYSAALQRVRANAPQYQQVVMQRTPPRQLGARPAGAPEEVPSRPGQSSGQTSGQTSSRPLARPPVQTPGQRPSQPVGWGRGTPR